MKTNHLSDWEQEEYVIGERTPEMLRHLGECAACRGTAERLQQGVASFRAAAVEWSSECLAGRPQRLQTLPLSRRPVVALRWAVAAVLPILLLVLALFSRRPWSTLPAHTDTASAISDDALLDQVDEQLSVAVPSSMESLTHLVSSGNSDVSGASTAAAGSRHLVQTN
jgi:hypothetical protein